jgi:hypothetical protein
MSCSLRGLWVDVCKYERFFTYRKRSGRDALRVVASEEHYTVPEIVSRIDPANIRRRGFPGPDVVWGQVIKRNELANLGDARLADMNASGITRSTRKCRHGFLRGRSSLERAEWP